MIPKHKCTPYCDPDEGIHCLPNGGPKGSTVASIQPFFPSLEVLKIQEEADIDTMTTFLRDFYADDFKSGQLLYDFYKVVQKEDTVGFLMWVREKRYD